MTIGRFLLLLSASLVAIIGAMYLSSLRHLDRDPRGQSLLPGLDAQLDDVAEIRLRKAGPAATVTMHRATTGRWTVQERGDYPADLSKIRKLLLELADAKIIEEKTSNPANYAILGVEGPTGPASSGVELSIITQGSTRTVIVGKPAGGGSFVRRGGAAQSFVIEPPIAVESDVRDWIDQALLSIPVDKIHSVRVQLADGSGYSISRQPSAAAPGATAPGSFTLDAVPKGREAAEPATIAPSPTSYTGVTADDVAAAAGIDFSMPSTCDIKLLDGSTYTLSGTVAADKHWLKATASKDDALNSRARERAFEVAAYRYDAIFRPLEQLLKPKPAKSPSAAAAKKPAGAH